VNFLGYTFRTSKILHGRAKRYLNMVPSEKAMKKERESLHQLTNRRQCHKPVAELIGEINRQLKGWRTTFPSDIRKPPTGRSTGIFQWFEEQGLIALSGCKAK